ncbi:MAG: mitochondrial fission ELM1 family protein [Verrucomicrobiota bacterium]
MTEPLILWLLVDGKPGHENQSLGLADALARRRPCEVHQISLAGKSGIFGRVRAALDASAGFPKPHLIIGAGHATHAALLWLARKHAAKSVVLMKPSLPLSWFSLCIVPEHDFADACRRENVIVTRGALNRVTAGDGEKSGKLILAGGPSKTHGWDGPALLDQLAQATDRGGWQLSDSRRTPAEFMEQARVRLPGVEVISHRDTPPGWVPEKLRQAKEVWVTEDSVSMIYEALTSGARVGVLPVPRNRGNSRVLVGVDRLVADGFLTPFSRWQENYRIASAPETLREADRCAELLLGRIS